MADAVTTQVLADTPARLILKFTNISDGVGESAAAKVALATYTTTAYPITKFTIEKVVFSTIGMGVDILWDATTDVLALTVPADQTGVMDFSEFGGIPNNAGAGVTQTINFTTVAATAADRYTIILSLRKG